MGVLGGRVDNSRHNLSNRGFGLGLLLLCGLGFGSESHSCILGWSCHLDGEELLIDELTLFAIVFCLED